MKELTGLTLLQRKVMLDMRKQSPSTWSTPVEVKDRAGLENPRWSINKALQSLEKKGFLESRPGAQFRRILGQ